MVKVYINILLYQIFNFRQFFKKDNWILIIIHKNIRQDMQWIIISYGILKVQNMVDLQ